MTGTAAEGQSMQPERRSLHSPARQRSDQTEVLGTLAHAQLPVLTQTTNTMLLYEALVAGNASSLPSLVLRSMLKQRRILMRMH